MSCKRICLKYQATSGKGSHYARGDKRCQECKIYLEYTGSRCPCCNISMRTVPRARKYKEKLRNQKTK